MFWPIKTAGDPCLGGWGGIGMRKQTAYRKKAAREDLSEAVVLTLNRFFRGRPIWHGALWPHVANLTAQQALWRPTPQRHCIWEIVRHIIFWRHWLVEHAAGRRIPDWRIHNWTLPEVTTPASWRGELRKLRASQRSLARLFRSTPGSRLLMRDDSLDPQVRWHTEATNGKFTKFWWLGVLAHDSYHTGQIASLRASVGLKPVD